VTLFDPSAPFDLDAYLKRIGFEGGAAADLPTLQTMALRHPTAIPFENLNPLLGRPVPLDVASLQRKLVEGGRGGWCFEHNLLLGTALAAVGFHVEGLAARVHWNVPSGVVRPRSHMVLHVDLDGQPYIVDAGFGGLTLSGPLRLEPGVTQQTPHERVRLTPAGEGFVVEVEIHGEWRALYRFDLQRQALADYEVTNWYLCNHPESHFVTGLVAARVQPDRRYGLRNTELSIHHRDGFTERRTLAAAAEIRAPLEQLFGIRVPAGDDIDAALARVAAAEAPRAAT
jgi:N-hydroxyarylamine O-acetyltransferase